VALTLVAVGGTGVVGEAQALEFEIIPTVGYIWDEDIQITGGKLEIDGSQSVGLVLDFDIWTGAELELSYIRQDTEVTLSDSTGTASQKLFDAALDFLQVGATLGARKGRTLTFSSVSIGMTHFNPKGVDASSSWKLSVTLGLGTKIYFTERVGIRLHGQLIPTFLSAGSDIFCYEGRCYSKLESGAMLQWQVSLGLVIVI
jgi:opacity protein-like surface antigen